MGKKNGKERQRHKKITYRYVTYTDENGVVYQAFEEVPVGGHTENRTIPLGPVPQGYDELDGDHSDGAEYECCEVLDDDEAAVIAQAVREHDQRLRGAFGEIAYNSPENEVPAHYYYNEYVGYATSWAAGHNALTEATTRCYEVPLPEPELNVQFSLSDASHLSDDAEYAVDLRRCHQTENELVRELPKGTRRIVKLGREAKQSLIQQLFGDVQYSDSDISDCSEIKQAERDEKEIQQNIEFFQQDIDTGAAADQTNQEDYAGAEDDYSTQNSSESAQSGIQDDDAYAEQYLQENEQSASDSTHQSDFEQPVGPRPLDEQYAYYSDSDNAYEPQQQKSIETLEDRIREAQAQNSNADGGKAQLTAAYVILISKKTGAVFYPACGDDSSESQDGVYVCTVTLPHERGRKETPEERRARKDAVKQAKQLRRHNREALKQQILEERKKVEASRRGNLGNVQGTHLQ